MSLRARAIVSIVMLAVLFLASAEVAQATPEAQPDITKVPAAAQPSDHFDVDAATDAYMDLMPASAKAHSDAYFEGGYWLILWDFLVGAIISLLLLNLGWSAWMRNVAERITRWKWLQTFIYWVEYLLLTSVLGFPLAVYEGFFREWKYGLATQTFGPWMWDQTKGLGLNVLLGGLASSIRKIIACSGSRFEKIKNYHHESALLNGFSDRTFFPNPLACGRLCG